ncbi:MazG nucleotide pyrophosphohydrolase domain-containing protein [Brachybacterium sp. YJGR34]|uniref:MazG nucleotide pyrophosphohydrolase domain-containing protein n=1 Tax=Brachybacterium sp. YJGR34 TaxID=2059911 RepID=UPI001E3C78E9|nr:MazG nucleotide pyrophosphohydrolase domain-containing protein [Brachybacterium sp. YJGR34]
MTPANHGSVPEAAPAEEPARRGEALLRALAVMDALRAPEGDAWTHRQSHASLARYLLEETLEVLEVIDDPAGHGPGALADELGDLLFQILFHARLGEEEDPAWDIDDVARSFVAKMERRNPHIFGEDAEAALEDPADVEQIIAQWHAVKAAEAAETAESAAAHAGGSAPDADGAAAGTARWFAGIPAGLPALQTAAKAVHRARSAGQLPELLRAAERSAEAEDAEQWGGDLALPLLELVVAAEARDVDPESALRALLARTRSGPAGV